MCADYAIHDTDGHNPHAHVMLTVRPLNEDGTWQYKTEKEYLCIRGGEEKGFTAEEFKEASKEGWEKQYQYKVGRKKVYMTPSAAEKEGYKRADKHPKATRFGRQNPTSARWNSEEQLIAWRAQWADAVNRALEHAKRQERIDHRSNKDRGIDEQPTIHEGVSSRTMEKKGISTERSELNRQIKEDNKAIRELKATILCVVLLAFVMAWRDQRLILNHPTFAEQGLRIAGKHAFCCSYRVLVTKFVTTTESGR